MNKRGKLVRLLLPRYFSDRLVPRVKLLYKRLELKRKYVYDGAEYVVNTISSRISSFNNKVLKYGHEVKDFARFRSVNCTSYIRDTQAKFVRFKDCYLRILFEEKFSELLGKSPSELVDASPCEVDSLYKKFYEDFARVRLRRAKPNAYYSLARAVFDECTVSSLLAY